MLADLYKQCAENRHEIIRQHMRLAIHIAKSICPHKFELPEYIAEAMLGLVIGAEKLTYQEGMNPSHYLSVCIRRRLYDLRISNQLFHVERDTHARRVAKGLGKIEIIPISDKLHFYGNVDQPQTEVKEILELCQLSELEQTILKLRMDGHRDPEIATRVNLTAARVGQIRKDIGIRWNRYANSGMASRVQQAEEVSA